MQYALGHGRSIEAAQRISSYLLDRQPPHDYRSSPLSADIVGRYDRRLLEAEEAEAREKEQKRDQKRDKKLALKQHGEEDDEEEGGMDPDMMALMGFGGFGTTSKK